MSVHRVLAHSVVVLALAAAGWSLSAADWESQPWGRSRELKATTATSPGFVRVPAASTGVTFTNLLSLDPQTTSQIYPNGSRVALGGVDGAGRCAVRVVFAG